MRSLLLIPLVGLAALLALLPQPRARQQDCPASGDPDLILRCEEQRLAVADDALDKEYRAVVRALHDDTTPDGQAALRTLVKAQRQWIQYRDDDCDAVYLAHGAAALRERHRLRCKIDHANQRVRQLGAFDTS